MNINAELPHSLSMEREIRHVIMSAYAGKDLLRPSPFQHSESASQGARFSHFVGVTLWLFHLLISFPIQPSAFTDLLWY